MMPRIYDSSFREYAQRYFGNADSVTSQQRNDFRELGFSVVFHHNITHAKTLEILSSPEMIRVLASS